jgi:integral membrane protein (TIGR01906 family)
MHLKCRLARRALILGIHTAIPFDIVKVGKSYGSVFELASMFLGFVGFGELNLECSDNQNNQAKEVGCEKNLHVVFSVILCIALSLMTITFSIGLPIYIRAFYYSQIDGFDLPAKTGYSHNEIKEAYDEVLDYLTLPGKEFGTGVFRFSESGKSHFDDCKILFDLNISVFIISSAVAALIFILHKKRVIKLSQGGGFGLPFFSGASTLFVFAVIGALIALDFDRAFVIFHSIFFPGKDNWLFDFDQDEIINVLPQDFFMRCAVLIGASVILISLAETVYGIIQKCKRK